MKLFSTLLLIVIVASCATAKEKTYTGSTPPNSMVRSFLGISLTDSIDFIRWKLSLSDDGYQLQCSYGICKPNTNGFINKKEAVLKGAVKKNGYYYQLHNGNKTLVIAEINSELLQLTDNNNHLLIGNGGWSYTLNNTNTMLTDDINIAGSQTVFKDSMVFEGRTPCGIPGVIEPGRTCYKVKWLISFYAEPGKTETGRCFIKGTLWRIQGGRNDGNWKLLKGKNGRIIYELTDSNGKFPVYLLKLDENILVFTDAEGKLLVGDEDFSYTLNRR